MRRPTRPAMLIAVLIIAALATLVAVETEI
jgi:hypothetical protein